MAWRQLMLFMRPVMKPFVFDIAVADDEQYESSIFY
jgi:hypothetical protein